MSFFSNAQVATAFQEDDNEPINTTVTFKKLRAMKGGWLQCLDEKTGYIVYVHEETRNMTYLTPLEAVGEAEHFDEPYWTFNTWEQTGEDGSYRSHLQKAAETREQRC